MVAQVRREAFSSPKPGISWLGRERVSRSFNRVIFCAAIALLPLTAIPYGTVEEWWESLFQCIVFALTALWLIEGLLGGGWLVREHRLLVPLVPLLVFIFLQAVPFGTAEVSGVRVWKTLSADAYETRLVGFRLLALLLLACLLLRYTSTQRRLRALVYTVFGVSMVSALFGLVRQAAHQEGEGFMLPYLQPQVGYAQFINPHHFALLMEMAFGLTLGLLAAGGARRNGRRLFCYLMVGVIVWAALVLSNSRGGIFGMLGALLFCALTFGGSRGTSRRGARHDDATRRALFHPSALVGAALIACLLLVMGAGIVWIGGEPLVGRMENLHTEVGAEGASNRMNPRRLEMWQATWRMIKQHPLGGTGFGGYWLAIDGYYDASGVSVPQQAHNDYLEIISSGGLIAVALVAWFVWGIVGRVRQCKRARHPFRRAVCKGALAGLCAVAIHSFVDFGLHVTVNAAVFTTLFVIAVAHVRSDEHKPTQTRAGVMHDFASVAAQRRRALCAALAGICLFACLFLMWQTAHAGLSRWYSISRARVYEIASAEQAVRLSPGDPAAQFFLAGLLPFDSQSGGATGEFERAVALRPRDHLLWINLGFARDRQGDPAGAVTAFQESVRLAPYYGLPRWQLGQALLRAGQRERAYAELSRAATSDPTLLEPALDLLWQTLDKDADALTQIISPQTSAAQLTLARFLIAHDKVAAAVVVLRLAGSDAADERHKLVAALIREKRFLEAYEVWSDGRVRSNGSERKGDVAIDNGSFEEQIKPDEPGFGWHVASKAKGLAISLDTKKAHAGSRSLRLDFKGDALAHAALVSHLIPTEAKMRYQLRFAAMTKGLTGDGPPLAMLIDAHDERILAPPFALPLNSNRWQDYIIDFVTGTTTNTVMLVIRRQDCTASPCLLFGQMWLDDFSLQKLSAVTGW